MVLLRDLQVVDGASAAGIKSLNAEID